MGLTEIVRVAEIFLPFFTGIKNRRGQRETVENHEIFHYLRLIEAQKIPEMPSAMRDTYSRIVEDYIPAFEGVLDEPRKNIIGNLYWERFMKARQRVIPTHRSRAGEEFFHLEKVVFQSIRDDIYRDKYDLLYHIFTLYLLFLKTLIDSYREVRPDDSCPQ